MISSIDSNLPFCSLYSTILFALLSPTPGIPVSSSSDAVLMLIFCPPYHSALPEIPTDTSCPLYGSGGLYFRYFALAKAICVKWFL
jgi:hypothetical protein